MSDNAGRTPSFAIIDTARQPYPEPCGDCGRDYLRGERIEWRVPALPSGDRLVWHGCTDCFLRRTGPSAPARSEDLPEANGDADV